MLSLHKLCHSAYAAGLDCDCKFYLGCIVERVQWAAKVPMCEPTTAVEGMSPID